MFSVTERHEELTESDLGKATNAEQREPRSSSHFTETYRQFNRFSEKFKHSKAKNATLLAYLHLSFFCQPGFTKKTKI